MNRVIMTDIASVVTERIASAFTALTAGGTGDATAVTGIVIDRASFGMAQSAEICILSEAVLAATKTLSITALKVEHSLDGSTNWADYAVATAPGVVSTGPAGGGTVRTQTTFGVNLSSAYRYIRVDFTPDLSATGTDTANAVALAVFGGFPSIPAAS
jgi:hypothetical protein